MNGTVAQVTKNILLSWTRLGLYVIIGFFMAPFLIHRLGDARYGIWILIGSISAYFNLFDFGIRISTVKFVAEYSAKKNQTGMNAVVSTAFFLYSFFGFLIILASLTVAFSLLHYFHIPPEEFITTRNLLLIIASGLALNLPLTVFGGVLGGLQQIALRSIIDITFLLIRTLLIIIFIRLGYGIIALGIITTIDLTITNLFYLLFSCRFLPDLRLHWRMVTPGAVQKVFGFSLYVFIMMIASMVIGRSDSVIIGIFLPVSAITLFSIGKRLTEYIGYLGSELGGAIFPTITHLDAGSEPEKRNQLFLYGTKFAVALFYPLCILLSLCGRDLIRFWVGEKYLTAYPLLLIIILGVMGSIALGIGRVVLLGIGKQRLMAILSTIEAVTTVVLSVILVRVSGLVGLAIGITGAFYLVNAGFTLPTVLRVLGIRFREFIGFIFKPLFVPLGVMALGFYFLRFFLPPQDLFSLGIECGTIFLIYLLFYYRFSTTIMEREIIRKRMPLVGEYEKIFGESEREW